MEYRKAKSMTQRINDVNPDNAINLSLPVTLFAFLATLPIGGIGAIPAFVFTSTGVTQATSSMTLDALRDMVNIPKRAVHKKELETAIDRMRFNLTMASGGIGEYKQHAINWWSQRFGVDVTRQQGIRNARHIIYQTRSEYERLFGER